MSVTVYADDIPVTSITAEQSEISLIVGDTKLLYPVIAPNDATDKTVVFTTSNSDVVTVTDNSIEAVGTGDAIITVHWQVMIL